MTQQDYVNRIEELNQSLKDAWSSDQKVKALKIVIQVSCTFLYRTGEFGGAACPIAFLGNEWFLLFSNYFHLFFTETHFFQSFMMSDNSWTFNSVVMYRF